MTFVLAASGNLNLAGLKKRYYELKNSRGIPPQPPSCCMLTHTLPLPHNFHNSSFTTAYSRSAGAWETGELACDLYLYAYSHAFLGGYLCRSVCMCVCVCVCACICVTRYLHFVLGKKSSPFSSNSKLSSPLPLSLSKLPLPLMSAGAGQTVLLLEIFSSWYNWRN